ncbi:transforming growth factor beta regulator 1 isoform X2 [Planococcus citri]|uniref:transforming growth factor beta regulator 1 isoform X2 n=1 Tax=Planococcus citri TaxID=170843 RepID=UPI0031F8A1D9
MFVNKSMAGKTIPKTATTQKFKTKYKKLKKYMLFMENAALCDQITYLQEKILYTKEENNFLARKLKHLEFLKNASGCEISTVDNLAKKIITKRKIQISPSQIIDTDVPIPKQVLKVKKPVKNVKKKQTLTVSEDACGQLSFPITLNDLTVHSLGEIVTDRSTYHTEDIIYPAGYVATKVYGSVHNPRMKCSYTCKIIDGGLYPKFEILSEDGLVFTGTTPDECHKKLLSLINNNYSAKVVNDTINRGADFFGLANPSVHYLILSLPGIPKCIKYSFKKFNERINLQDDVLMKDDVEACINYSALVKVLPESFNRDPFGSSWLPG